ncbi:hypothetical protein C0J50_6770 [Silurus asotus]|uniref:C2H2-type domain-containing protein n=1 Tax=Silurus asotus TaxID=30991 RepID=A0AAD5A1R1_SILAS|nr:hypothetical protein C0J50_6770 [Silurus asotus]
MAHNTESSADSGPVAELSVSFHEELSASIQSAFGVAGELAVSEVSRLVLKAFRDVRDQLHKSLQANRNLQARLNQAQKELRGTRRTRDAAVNTSPISPAETMLDAGGTQEDLPGEPYACQSFREIGEDGLESVQDVKPSLTLQPRLQQLQETEGIKVDSDSIQEAASHADQVCIGVAMVPEASAIQIKGRLSFEPGRTAKLEDADQCAYSKSDSEHEFSPDSLSMAQSKLLEDWRPDPLQHPSCQADAYASSCSSALGDLPGMDFLASASSSQPNMCHEPLSGSELSAQSHPNPLFPTHNSGQAHTLDQSFSIPAEVRRYRSALQPKPPSHQHKSPKRNLYPPGRSPFHCSQCGRDFNRMEHLKIHQRIHTGEKPYVCTECTARFRHSWALTRHFRIHTGEKPYVCAQCGKSFRNCGGLRFHQRTHARGGLNNAKPNLEGYGRT